MAYWLVLTPAATPVVLLTAWQITLFPLSFAEVGFGEPLTIASSFQNGLGLSNGADCSVTALTAPLGYFLGTGRPHLGFRSIHAGPRSMQLLKGW